MSFAIVGGYMNKMIMQKIIPHCGSITIQVDDIKEHIKKKIGGEHKWQTTKRP